MKKETLSQKRRRAANMGNRKLHDYKRDHPSRQEMALSKAIKLARFKVIGWEFEVEDGEWMGWFNCAVIFQEKLCLIDFTTNPAAKTDKRAMQKKADYCKKYNIDLFIIKVGSVVQMQAELEFWKLKQRRKLAS